jgi:hypothetical protein
MLKNLETPGDHGCTGAGDVSAELKDRAKARSFCLSKPAERAQRKKFAEVTTPASGADWPRIPSLSSSTQVEQCLLLSTSRSFALAIKMSLRMIAVRATILSQTARRVGHRHGFRVGCALRNDENLSEASANVNNCRPNAKLSSFRTSEAQIRKPCLYGGEAI